MLKVTRKPGFRGDGKSTFIIINEKENVNDVTVSIIESEDSRPDLSLMNIKVYVEHPNTPEVTFDESATVVDESTIHTIVDVNLTIDDPVKIIRIDVWDAVVSMSIVPHNPSDVLVTFDAPRSILLHRKNLVSTGSAA